MTHSVITFPQSILCGKCGYPVLADENFRVDQPLIVRCHFAKCEDHDIPLTFPATRIELQRAE